MQLVVAIAAHDVPARPPLTLVPGELVTALRRDGDWPAFVFVEADHGSGWVPSRTLAPAR